MKYKIILLLILIIVSLSHRRRTKNYKIKTLYNKILTHKGDFIELSLGFLSAFYIKADQLESNIAAFRAIYNSCKAHQLKNSLKQLFHDINNPKKYLKEQQCLYDRLGYYYSYVKVSAWKDYLKSFVWKHEHCKENDYKCKTYSEVNNCEIKNLVKYYLRRVYSTMKENLSEGYNCFYHSKALSTQMFYTDIHLFDGQSYGKLIELSYSSAMNILTGATSVAAYKLWDIMYTLYMIYYDVNNRPYFRAGRLLGESFKFFLAIPVKRYRLRKK
jgi:hypothetical protein